MKKFLSLIIAVMFTLGLNAQTKEAPDFTATDYSGNEINLYEILEGGQYVLLHITTKNVSDDDDAQKEYNLNLQLVDLATGLTFWQRRVPLRKLVDADNIMN